MFGRIFYSAISKLFFITRKPRIIYFHVPKCGGTTVSYSLLNILDKEPKRLIERLFNVRKSVSFFDHLDTSVQWKVNYRRSMKTRFIRGHFSWKTYQKFGPKKDDIKFTFLREPRERLMSSYRFIFSDSLTVLPKTKDGIVDPSITLRRFLEFEHPKLQGQFDNIMVRTFSGGYDQKFCSTAEWREALELAKTNLMKLNFIGFQDTIDKDIRTLHSLVGLEEPKNIEWRKRSIRRENVEIDEVAEDLLNRYTMYDMELYKFAKSLYASRLEGYRNL